MTLAFKVTLNYNTTNQHISYMYSALNYLLGVLRGSMVKCLTCNREVLGSSRTRSSEFFRESVLGQDTSEP